jgi:hypothetical protein
MGFLKKDPMDRWILRAVQEEFANELRAELQKVAEPLIREVIATACRNIAVKVESYADMYEGVREIRLEWIITENKKEGNE